MSGAARLLFFPVLVLAFAATPALAQVRPDIQSVDLRETASERPILRCSDREPCPEGSTCVEGTCIALARRNDACRETRCEPGETCWGGLCFRPPSARVACEAGTVQYGPTCLPVFDAEAFREDRCAADMLVLNGICFEVTVEPKVDPCSGVKCEEGETCFRGLCYASCEEGVDC